MIFSVMFKGNLGRRSLVLESSHRFPGVTAG